MQNQIYITCLAAYSNGHLHGKWVPVTDLEALNKEIDELLKSSPVPNAEEIFITDFDLMGASIEEYASTESIIELNEFLEEHGQVGAELYNYYGGNLQDAINKMEDFIGSYESYEDYATDYIESCGEKIPAYISWHIDYRSLGESLLYDSLVITTKSDNNLYVFHH